MADRTRAALAELQNDHLQITSLMNELIEAGKADHDEELTKLATRVAIQSLNDVEDRTAYDDSGWRLFAAAARERRLTTDDVQG